MICFTWVDAAKTNQVTVVNQENNHGIDQEKKHKGTITRKNKNKKAKKTKRFGRGIQKQTAKTKPSGTFKQSKKDHFDLKKLRRIAAIKNVTRKEQDKGQSNNDKSILNRTLGQFPSIDDLLNTKVTVSGKVKKEEKKDFDGKLSMKISMENTTKKFKFELGGTFGKKNDTKVDFKDCFKTTGINIKMFGLRGGYSDEGNTKYTGVLDAPGGLGDVFDGPEEMKQEEIYMGFNYDWDLKGKLKGINASSRILFIKQRNGDYYAGGISGEFTKKQLFSLGLGCMLDHKKKASAQLSGSLWGILMIHAMIGKDKHQHLFLGLEKKFFGFLEILFGYRFSMLDGDPSCICLRIKFGRSGSIIIKIHQDIIKKFDLNEHIEWEIKFQPKATVTVQEAINKITQYQSPTTQKQQKISSIKVY